MANLPKTITSQGRRPATFWTCEAVGPEGKPVRKNLSICRESQHEACAAVGHCINPKGLLSYVSRRADVQRLQRCKHYQLMLKRIEEA